MEAQRRILLVNPDEDLLSLLDFALRRSGYAVVAARDPQQALRLRITDPDVAILDAYGHEEDERALKAALHRDHHVPIIKLTGDAELPLGRCSFDSEVDAFIRKPFSYGALIACIEANLRLVEGRDASSLRVG